MHLRKITFLLLLSLFCLLLISCSKGTSNNNSIIIFHAGSLSVPLTEIKKSFLEKNPDADIVLEPAGSRKCARKISDLNRDCDVMLSADYSVINQLLIPKYASWCIKFVSNQMTVVYTDKSKYAKEINSDNWYKILMREGVVCGISNPNDDPCGYRSVLTMKLAQIYYKCPGLESGIRDKKKGLIMRPKETDLLSLLESNNIDYIFLYKSVAEQHHLKYIKLPEQINLSDPAYSDYYKKAEIKISGNKPGTFITKKGAPMLYGVTIPKNAPNPDLALKFVEFLLNNNEGLKIMKENGQQSVVPSFSKTYNNIPAVLKQYALVSNQ
jgi:molybdate/tungstate transport system substrate-binding protein